MYKHPPYVLYADPGKPWNFSVADASLMARLGFNVVRLGRHLERVGARDGPGQRPRHLRPRARRRIRTSSTRPCSTATSTGCGRPWTCSGRFHIYTILDMHQDVYNQMFDGEGAPNWAVCTNGVPNVDRPGRWSLEYGTAAAGIAFTHFWRNNVRGDLQGEYDRVWGDLARAFRGQPVGPRLRPLQRALLHVAGPLR